MPQKGGREGGRERAREGRGGRDRRREGEEGRGEGGMARGESEGGTRGGIEGGGRGRKGGGSEGRRVLSVSIFAGESGIVHKAKYRGEVVAVKILKG